MDMEKTQAKEAAPKLVLPRTIHLIPHSLRSLCS